MKKTFLATLSLCAFLTSAAYAENASEPKSETKAAKNQAIDGKEAARRAQIEKIASCKNILSACEKSGFVAGGFKNGNGLWRNCFHPIVEGKSASLKGKEVSIAANASDATVCKVEVEKHKAEKAAKQAAKKAAAETKSATVK